MDLSGAKGVLVNITAGLDLSIGEFEEVGEVVKNITSESATVVVGTVIDPELRDEVRVTVIVTGLGRKQVTAGLKPASVEVPKRHEAAVDYIDFEKPAIMRKQTAPIAASPTGAPASTTAPSSAAPAAAAASVSATSVPTSSPVATPAQATISAAAMTMPVQSVSPSLSASLSSQPQLSTKPITLSDNLHDIDYLDIPAFLRRKEEEA